MFIEWQRVEQVPNIDYYWKDDPYYDSLPQEDDDEPEEEELEEEELEEEEPEEDEPEEDDP